MFRFIKIVFAVMVFALAAGAAGQAQAKVVMLMSGNTMGMFRACPSCKNVYGFGGLDRRSTVINAQLEGQDTVFIMSAGNDLTSYMKDWQPENGLLEALSKAYETMGYDFGVLSGTDRMYYTREGAEPPRGFVPADEVVSTRILEKGGVKLGLVVFPVLERGQKPSEAQSASVVQAAAALKGQCDMVVGVSTWGERVERNWLAANPGVLGMLLGSGPGSGSGGRVTEGGQTLWVRGDFEGRALFRLDLSAYIEQGAWNEKNDPVEKIILDHNVKGDGRVSAYFAWI